MNHFYLLQTMSVETSPDKQSELRDFMRSKGYIFLKHIQNQYAHDDIFLHKSVNSWTN